MIGEVSGAGTFVALSALPMVVGLLLPEGIMAARWRRVAILLAVLLPAIFLLLVAVVYLIPQGNASAFFDFSVNYRAALAVYRDGLSPYSVAAAYSFPFPSFYLYWLVSGFGQLNESQAWIVWWVINAVLWAVCVWLLWRLIPFSEPRRPDATTDLRRYAAVALPAALTLWQGQTALMILLGLVLLHGGLVAGSSWRMRLLGGVGLALATLIKPQLGLVGVGLLIFMAWQPPTQRLRIVTVLGASLISAMILIAATLLLPGGIALDHYVQFVRVLPSVAQPSEALIIGSPAYVVAALTRDDRLSTVVTVALVILAGWWTWRRRDREAVVIAAGWGVWAIVAPRIAWTWYATWALPFFLLAIPALHSRWQRVMAVIILALMSLQLQDWPSAILGIGLLIYFLWIS